MSNRVTLTQWGAFFAWAAIGAMALAGLLAVFAIPVFLVLEGVAGAGALALSARKTTRVGTPGLVFGVAVLLLYLAYLNRNGPGDVCVSHAGQECTSVEEQWSPWPWLLAGLVLATVGVVAFVQTRRAAQARDALVP